MACLTTTFARAAWVSGWPSSPKPPSTNSGPGASSSPGVAGGRPSSCRTNPSCSGTSVTTTSFKEPELGWHYQSKSGERYTLGIIPDTPEDLDSLEATIAHLESLGKPYLVDPIIEPIGFGFMASLERYADVHRRYPAAPGETVFSPMDGQGAGRRSTRWRVELVRRRIGSEA